MYTTERKVLKDSSPFRQKLATSSISILDSHIQFSFVEHNLFQSVRLGISKVFNIQNKQCDVNVWLPTRACYVYAIKVERPKNMAIVIISPTFEERPWGQCNFAEKPG